jgi:hypothetical protein
VGVFLAEASGCYGLDKTKMQRLSLGSSWSSSAQTQHTQPAVCGQSSYVTAVHRFPVSTRPKTARRASISQTGGRRYPRS